MAGKRILGKDPASSERPGELLKKKGNALASASISQLLAATAGQQGREKQDKMTQAEETRRSAISETDHQGRPSDDAELETKSSTADRDHQLQE
jgi:hypothetical protein